MQLSIVSYLDAAAATKVRKLQEAVSAITGSKAALYSWQPHITVGDGVEVNENDELKRLADEVKELTRSCRVFEVTSTEFGARDSRPIGRGELSTPYVLEVKVEANKLLLTLVEDIAHITSKYKKWYRMPTPYSPHVTIAFRDLDKKGYEAGLHYLKEQHFETVVTIDHIALVEKLNDRDVEVVRFGLKG